jgi:hypothetical protein
VFALLQVKEIGWLEHGRNLRQSSAAEKPNALAIGSPLTPMGKGKAAPWCGCAAAQPLYLDFC